jgi:hypothetical protein
MGIFVGYNCTEKYFLHIFHLLLSSSCDADNNELDMLQNFEGNIFPFYLYTLKQEILVAGVQ